MFHVLDIEELSKLIKIAEPSKIARKCLKLDDSGGTITTGFKQNIPIERKENLTSYYGFESSNLNFFSKNLYAIQYSRAHFDQVQALIFLELIYLGTLYSLLNLFFYTQYQVIFSIY